MPQLQLADSYSEQTKIQKSAKKTFAHTTSYAFLFYPIWSVTKSVTLTCRMWTLWIIVYIVKFGSDFMCLAALKWFFQDLNMSPSNEHELWKRYHSRVCITFVTEEYISSEYDTIIAGSDVDHW